MVSFKSGKENFEIRLRDGNAISLDKYYYLDFPVSSKSTLGEKEALVFEAPNSYCDDPACSDPFIAYSTKNGDDFYNLVFSGDAKLSNTEKSILSSFEFTNETANWQTYRNSEYGFEFKYPNEWGEVVFIQRDCVDSGKLYRAEFSLNKKISFGGNSSNCQEGRGAGFLDFSYYTLSGNEVTHNYSNKQSKFTASEIITLSDQDKAILVYEQDLGLLINHSKLGVLVNLKNTTFPGLAFLSEDVSN